MVRLILIVLMSFSLMACGATRLKYTQPAKTAYLDQGKRFFEEGFYKRALHELLPFAADGDPEAQYAVGYMYYYGYGAAQDTEVGYFWINRSARQGYEPAELASSLIERNRVLRTTYPERLS